MTLKVLTWFWRQSGGRVQYEALHVNIWADMVRRNLSIPHTIACVTDIREGIDPSIEIIAPPREFEDARIPTWRADRPQCLRRLSMFRRDAARIFGKRFVCMDLDCVIAAPIDDLFRDDCDFRMFRGTAPGRPYNGSMMLIKAGTRPQVYERFNLDEAIEAGKKFVGSDQAWISHVLGPKEKTWGPEHGVRWWNRGAKVPDDTRLMFFPGYSKPWHCVDNGDNWVATRYRLSSHGRCLILGYAPSVWDEAAVALERGAFDAVIASPEAAEHWPYDVVAVASDDEQAERLARMLGYDDIVFCGRTPQDSLAAALAGVIA